MGVGQHARPQVGVLGLGSIVVCEDVAKWAFQRRSDQRAALARVANCFPKEMIASRIFRRPFSTR